ncbi:MAG: TrmO family methyltransferase [Desulfobacteraceae bacterium]|nr:TrmO family methyltransferase [Desulfobacteraceae bacterium]
MPRFSRPPLPRQGIFATCSSARPNPVLVSAVPLLERHGNTLKARGLEAVDGSPVIDIKPYAASYYGAGNATVPEWTFCAVCRACTISGIIGNTKGRSGRQPGPAGYHCSGADCHRRHPPGILAQNPDDP